MQSALFALLGVVLGVCLTMVSKGELSLKSKREKEKVNYKIEPETDKNEIALMRQWQNLLSYGADKEDRSYI